MPRRTRLRRSTTRRWRGAALALSLVFLAALALAVGAVLGRMMVTAMLAAARDDSRPAVLEPGGTAGGASGGAGEPPSVGTPGGTAGGAAPPAAATATAAPTLPATTWYGVQLGVFSDPDRAREYQTELAGRGVVAAAVAAGDLHRLYTAVGPDEAAARAAAERLGAQGIDRFVVAFSLHATPVRIAGPEAAVRALSAGWEAWWAALDAQARAWRGLAPGATAGDAEVDPPAGGWAAAVDAARASLEEAVAAAGESGAAAEAARRLLVLTDDLAASAAGLDAGARDAAGIAGYAAFLRAAVGYATGPGGG